MATAQEETLTFFTDDMALAAFLVMRGHEVVSMRSERLEDSRKQVFWGFDRDEGLDGEVVGAMGGEVTINLYKFMGSLRDVRELMYDYQDNPSLFDG